MTRRAIEHRQHQRPLALGVRLPNSGALMEHGASDTDSADVQTAAGVYAPSGEPAGGRGGGIVPANRPDRGEVIES